MAAVPTENGVNCLAVSRSQELVLVFFNRNNTKMNAKRTDPYGPQTWSLLLHLSSLNKVQTLIRHFLQVQWAVVV